MSSFPILDLVVGVIFIFFLLSIICSSIVEMILTVRRVRAQVLGKWLLSIFDTKITTGQNQQVPLGQAIMDHCALTALSPKGAAPSYIDAKNFVSALLDKITEFSQIVNPTSIDDFIKSLNSTTAISDELRRSFLIYANEAKDTFDALTVKTTGAIEMFRHKMENWYNSNMERLTGTLKSSYTRRFTFISAVVVCLLINADTIEISKYLYSNPEARAALAEQAYKTGTDDSIKQDMQQLKQHVDSINNDTAKLTFNQLDSSINSKVVTINKARAELEGSIPLGWNKAGFTGLQDWGWVAKLIGIAITVIAIMMGAPFWFDVLNKISNLRGTGSRPDVAPTDTKT
jgi:hypothetical protein